MISMDSFAVSYTFVPSNSEQSCSSLVPSKVISLSFLGSFDYPEHSSSFSRGCKNSWTVLETFFSKRSKGRGEQQRSAVRVERRRYFKRQRQDSSRSSTRGRASLMILYLSYVLTFLHQSRIVDLISCRLKRKTLMRGLRCCSEIKMILSCCSSTSSSISLSALGASTDSFSISCFRLSLNQIFRRYWYCLSVILSSLAQGSSPIKSFISLV